MFGQLLFVDAEHLAERCDEVAIGAGANVDQGTVEAVLQTELSDEPRVHLLYVEVDDQMLQHFRFVDGGGVVLDHLTEGRIGDVLDAVGQNE